MPFYRDTRSWFFVRIITLSSRFQPTRAHGAHGSAQVPGAHLAELGKRAGRPETVKAWAKGTRPWGRFLMSRCPGIHGPKSPLSRNSAGRHGSGSGPGPGRVIRDTPCPSLYQPCGGPGSHARAGACRGFSTNVYIYQHPGPRNQREALCYRAFLLVSKSVPAQQARCAVMCAEMCEPMRRNPTALISMYTSTCTYPWFAAQKLRTYVRRKPVSCAEILVRRSDVRKCVRNAPDIASIFHTP